MMIKTTTTNITLATITPTLELLSSDEAEPGATVAIILVILVVVEVTLIKVEVVVALLYSTNRYIKSWIIAIATLSVSN